MSEQHFKPTDYFDPAQWSGVYDPDKKDDGAFIFTHGADLVFDISAALARTGGRWLDVGCGTGHLAAKLSEAGLSVVAVDHDPRMIDLAKKRFSNKPQPDNLKFTPANAYDLPFADDTFDGVVAASLAGCLSSPDKFFREVHRVLHKGGFAVITFTNRSSLLLKINWYIRKKAFKAGKLTADAFSYRLYRCARVVEDLQKTGLRMVKVRYYNFFLNPGSRLIPSKTFALYLENLGKYKIGRRLGRNFVIVAQKM